MFSQIKTKVTQSVSFLTRNVSYMGNLKPNDGAVVSYKRLGRGPASGKGKTSGRGQKGQKARGKVPRWLEGGQTPYYKLFPIIGFKRPHKRVYFDLNLERIQEFWNTGRIPLQAGETLTIRTMKECGLITGTMKDGVKILANGKEDYSVPLNIEASRASDQAIQAIEKLEKSYTSVYFTKLSLDAHINPERFLLKKGYVPLPARPSHRRDIEYYSNPAKRGYLLKDRSLLLDHLKNVSATYTKAEKKSALERQAEVASPARFNEFHEGKVVSVNDL
ncbi:ribosomal protein L15 [Suhomyces tanzawaensis NRRL Y-17324]|uniref:Ribosomal protein L15 n=1 Tax=Suhomyces tanzawaensis NRRL Y-17324 TaxID=984487 RepID=A0A1E4SET5_9ASCO|nr:ribosomal protein L15 [Suhomyces tanzawaensis NRRL Y-17324]ODV78034.1 ribosomal protein L15 [Suhomyces tanzawaensis NRRL Y-17324]